MILKNVMGSPKSSFFGLVIGMLQSAIVVAASQYMQTGNTTDWRPYAAAGAVGAASALRGALQRDPAPEAEDYMQGQISKRLRDDPGLHRAVLGVDPESR